MSKIKQLIQKGEGKRIEFKKTLPDGNNLAKSVIAFSNMAGGKIVIGIEDKTAKVIGISDDEVLEFPDRISNIIHDRCYPFILPEIYLVYIDNATILVIEIFPGALKPYYLKNKGKQKGTYIRVGATNKAADIEMIRELERQRQNISFDEELNYESDKKSLDIERLRTDFQGYTGRKLTETNLLNLRILKEENGRFFPTIGGMLLAGKTDYLEYARIKCARFKGTNMDIFIDQKEFTGPLYRQVEEAMKFAHIYIALSGKVEGLQRIDRYEVPLEVIREAIVNAVVHRDYSISGSDIKFAIFEDRIEITSPGALPRSLEIEDIITGRSEIRNKVIARFFKEIDFIEQWGSGIRKMLRLLKEAGLPEPQFRESGLFFKMIIFKKDATTIETTAPTSGENEKIGTKTFSEEDIGTSREIAEEKGTTIETTTETTAKSVDDTTATTSRENGKIDLKSIPDDGIGTSREMGEEKTTTIETAATTSRENGKIDLKSFPESDMGTSGEISEIVDSEAAGKILKLIKEKPFINAAELGEQLHITEAGVRYHLAKLKQEGILKRAGSTKAGYWKINE